MKFLFFDDEERTCSIENEAHMREFILSGKLKGKTLLYDYENDVLDKASQFGEFSRLVNRIMKEKTGMIDTATGSQEVSYKKTMSAGEKFIINNKKAAGNKKNSRGCLIGILILAASGWGLIKTVIGEFDSSDSNSQIESINYQISTEQSDPPELLFIYDSLRSFEKDFQSDYDSIDSALTTKNFDSYLNNSIMESKDSLKLYKRKINELKKIVTDFKVKESNRFMDFLAFINGISASNTINLQYLPDMIIIAQKGDSTINKFYEMKLGIIEKHREVYDFFISIQGEFRFEGDRVVFNKQEQLDKYNELTAGLKECKTGLDDWATNRENYGIFRNKAGNISIGY